MLENPIMAQSRKECAFHSPSLVLALFLISVFGHFLICGMRLNQPVSFPKLTVYNSMAFISQRRELTIFVKFLLILITAFSNHLGNQSGNHQGFFFHFTATMGTDCAMEWGERLLVLMLRLQEMESFCCQLLVQIIVSFGL
jgi:hypothetical protein